MVDTQVVPGDLVEVVCPGHPFEGRFGEVALLALHGDVPSVAFRVCGQAHVMAATDVRRVAPLQRAVRIVIPGQPAGKGSIRSRAVNTRDGRSFIAHHKDKDTANRMAFIRSLAVEAMAGRPPIVGPVAMHSLLVLRVPASWSRKQRAEALAGRVLPTVKPDLSNFLKLAEDSMNEVVFADDKNICRSTVSKVYGETPQAVIDVFPMGQA